MHLANQFLRIAASTSLGIVMIGYTISFSGCTSSTEVAKEDAALVSRSGSQPFQVEVQAENYIIRQADEIQISVWSYPEINTTAPVKETGAITIPLVGEVTVAGLTKEQFVVDLSKKLSEYLQGEIKLVVTVKSAGVKEITILGQVTHQQTYPLNTDITLFKAIALAGGTTNEADLRHVRILRGTPNRQPIEVDVTSFVENGNINEVPIIRPGDTIVIAKQEDVIMKMATYMTSAVFLFSFFVLLK